MGYSFTDLGAEGCCRSLNALLLSDKSAKSAYFLTLNILFSKVVTIELAYEVNMLTNIMYMYPDKQLHVHIPAQVSRVFHDDCDILFSKLRHCVSRKQLSEDICSNKAVDVFLHLGDYWHVTRRGCLCSEIAKHNRQWESHYSIASLILYSTVYFFSDAIIMLVYYKEIGEVFYIFHHGAVIYAYYYVMVSWWLIGWRSLQWCCNLMAYLKQGLIYHLEENFAQIHLPDRQFHLPWAIR